MTKDEALTMAIEALEMHVPHYVKDRGCEALNACKEALEQPTQDYVLICKKCGDDLGIEYVPVEPHTMTYEQGFEHGYEAHKSEQALEQPTTQEPVGITYRTCAGYIETEFNKEVPVGTSLYTHPKE